MNPKEMMKAGVLSCKQMERLDLDEICIPFIQWSAYSRLVFQPQLDHHSQRSVAASELETLRTTLAE